MRILIFLAEMEINGTLTRTICKCSFIPVGLRMFIVFQFSFSEEFCHRSSSHAREFNCNWDALASCTSDVFDEHSHQHVDRWRNSTSRWYTYFFLLLSCAEYSRYLDGKWKFCNCFAMKCLTELKYRMCSGGFMGDLVFNGGKFSFWEIIVSCSLIECQ